MEYVLKNASQSNEPGARYDTERLRGLWGEDLFEDLAKLNQLDMDLYRTTCDEVQRRFALVPNAEIRLSEFRSRCKDFQVMTACAN
jgi:hypothetical protein